MNKYFRWISALMICVGLLSTGPGNLIVVGAPLTNVFGTGLDNAGKLLPANTIDPHYRLLVSPDTNSPGPAVYTLTAGFPVPPWIAEGPDSKWIAPKGNQSSGSAPGDYIYRTTFDLTGYDINKVTISGAWVSDNGGTDILLNDVSLGISQGGDFANLNKEFTITSGFVAGVNTLDFVVNNAGTDINPTGLRVNLRGTVELTAEVPYIITQPKSKTILMGEDTSLTAVAEGTQPLMYQWRLNGKDIFGANEATYLVTGAVLAQDGDYTVEIRNVAGAKVSAVAKLTVLEPLTGLYNTGVQADNIVLDDLSTDTHYKLVVNADGASQDTVVQDSTLFPIVAGPWLANSETSKWIGPRGETSAAAGGDYTYRLTFDLTGMDPTTAFLAGRWTSDNGGLDILINGGSTGISQSGGFGGYYDFSVTNGFVSGVNQLEFKVRNEGAGYTGLRVDNLRGGAKRKSVTGLEAPRIAVQPASKTAYVGDSVTLAVVADGSKPISYQWKFKGQNMSGKTDASLVLDKVTTSQAGEYYTVVSNAAGSTNTAIAVLTVLQPIPGLFGTGLAKDGSLLQAGAVDPHYQLVTNAHTPKSLDALIEDSTVWPIVAGPWLLPNSASQWIGPQQDPNGAGGDYAFQTTFDLTGFNPSTAIIEGNWATDNVGMDILINGTSTGLQNNSQFSSWTHFVITNGFKSGTNTLVFLLNNAGAEVNPVGFRVESLKGGAITVPTANPKLAISRTGNEITLSWPISASDYKLFVASDLAKPAWQEVAIQIVTSVDMNTVKISAASGWKFYRLQK